jgi:hypothetical protein
VEHLVRFTSAEGRDGYHTAASLDDALKFVERLRNNEEVDRVRLFRLQEVPIEFKAYYKVELRASDGPAAPAPDGALPEPEVVDALPAPAPPSEEDDAGLVAAPGGAADGGRRLFGRS